MNGDSQIRERAERHFTMIHDRHEKGSALSLIAAETKAVDAKTARLKALRLESGTAVKPEPRKPVRSQAAKRIVRR